MRKERTHRWQAVLAKILVAVMIITYVTLLPKPPVYSAGSPVLNVTSQKIPVGGTYNLNITNKPAKATYQWNSGDKRVATVDPYGLVTGIKRGKALITCTVKTKSDTYQLFCNITVIKPATVFRIMNKSSVLNLGQEYSLESFIAPNTSDDMVTWSSNNPAIAAPDSFGRFTTKQEGTVTITGKTLSGKTDSMTFRVIGKEGVVTNQKELEDFLKTEVNRITLRTAEALKLTIPRGDYSDKQLIIEAPKADISNYGVFASIDIKKIAKNSWFENAVGNELHVYADSRIVVSPFAKVNIDVNSEEAKLSVENYGVIEDLVVTNSSDIIISGNTKQKTPVTVNVSDITLTSSVPLSLSLNKKIELVLLSGAEKSLIQAASTAVIPTIKSNSRYKVIVGEGINVVEHEVIPTPIVDFVPSGNGGTGGDDGSTSNLYKKTFLLDRPISEITAINASYAGRAYTITSSALDLLIGLINNNPTYMSLWMDVEEFSQTYDGQTFYIKGTAGSMTKEVSFAGGQFDGRSYMVTVGTNNLVRVVSKASSVDFTITKSADDKALIITGDYTRLSGLTFTIIAGNTYILERSYKELESILVTYNGITYEVDASLLSTLDFFLSKEGFYLEVWNNTTNTTKNYNGQIVKVSGVAGSSTKTVTFEGGSLDGKSYTVTVNTDHSVTIVSNASGLAFTVNKGTDERSLTITGAPKGLIFAPSFE